MGPALVRQSTLGVVLFALWLLAAASWPAFAQADQSAWPQRNVRFVLPFGPGSGADVTARLLSERLQTIWGRPVLVENRPGGDSLLALNGFVSANDDHTMYLGPTSIPLVHAYQHDNLPYDPERDLAPITLLTRTPVALAGGAAGPATLTDFVANVKANPGKVNFATVAGYTEFMMEAFVREHALVMAKVPYRDIVQAPVDLGEGRIQLVLASLPVLQPHVQAGRIRLLALADRQPNDLTPGVPTVVQAGFPGLEAITAVGLFGKRDMPLDLRRRIAAQVTAIMKSPEVVARLRTTSQLVVAAGPDELVTAIAEQSAMVARTAKVLGVARKGR